MTPFDYDKVILLWQETEGMGLHNDADSREGIAQYLARNPHLSFAAHDDHGEIIGAVLCGHDGRRGYLHHLAVIEKYRYKGIGKMLVKYSLKGLADIGISKCHIFIFGDNYKGQAFWKHIGWKERLDLKIMSTTL